MSDTVYRIITERIIEQLRAGTAPWRQEWTTDAAPRSIVGRRYTGINVFLTLCRGYGSPYWLTRNHIRQRGGRVRDDEWDKRTQIIFWKRHTITDKVTGEDKTIPLLRYYTVWNLEQVEGIDPPADHPAMRVHPTEDRHHRAEEIIAGYPDRPHISEAGAEAVYNPTTDRIVLPPRATFGTLDEFYTTAYHELGHSTGHPARLNRNLGRLGSHAYGREELVAEMTAAFLSAEAGIQTTLPNSASYLNSWINTLQEDVRAVVVAAGAAQRAADHILGRARDTTSTCTGDGADRLVAAA